MKKTSLNYKYKVGDIIIIRNRKMKILEQIIMNKNNVKGYKYHCLQCGNIDTISEINLIYNHRGCNVCCIPSHKVLKGYNDIATTNKYLFGLLVNKEDGYKYTQGSSQYVDWKCPECGNIIKSKEISMVNTCGLSCPKCGDGISFGQKVLFNILDQLHINFVTEKIFNWSNKKRYDFYFKINNNEYIIEVQGSQHYQEWSQGRSLKEEQENDRLKKELAVQHDIKEENYIIIDCRKSELDWVKNHVIHSKLADIFDLSNINWLKCHRYACSSLVKQTCDLWNNGIQSIKRIIEIMKLSRTTIKRYLRQGAKSNWCNYDPNKRILRNNKVSEGKKIICLNNGKIFKSITEALNYCNLKTDHIGECCKNTLKSCGRDPITGEKLQWQYYNEYLIKPKELINNVEINKIICLNDKNIFNYPCDAIKYYNIKSDHIFECCRGKRKSAGKDPITGKRLKWMYYEDYLKNN